MYIIGANALIDDLLQLQIFTAGSDYNVPDIGTITFQPGGTEACYEIPIVNDHEHESSEKFTASLSTTDSDVNIVNSNVTITITDDDEPGRLFSIINAGGTVEPLYTGHP